MSQDMSDGCADSGHKIVRQLSSLNAVLARQRLDKTLISAIAQ